jgi:hypothetical protein
MKKALWGYVFILFALVSFCGCGAAAVPLIFGAAAGGTGMYAASKDTIQADTDTPYEALWDAAIKVARIRGTIKQEDVNRGYIEVDAKPNKIWVNFARLTAATTRVSVSARKYKFPNIDLAQEIYSKIIEESKR